MPITTPEIVLGVTEGGFENYADWLAAMKRLKLEIDRGKIDSAIAREQANRDSDTQTHNTELQRLQALRLAKQAEIDALEQ